MPTSALDHRAGGPLRILVVASRDPGGRRTGRKTVIETIVRSLVSLGHTVEVAALSPRPLEPAPWGDLAPVHRVDPPGVATVVSNVALRASRARLSFNECLFYSGHAARRIRDLADLVAADLVVADMIRTYELAAATGRPVVLDLDDLLSERYRAQARGGADPANILGYAGDHVPSPLVRPVAVLASKGLAVEARLMARRELQAARAAAVTCMVSGGEASRLAERTGRPVEWAPMAVAVSDGPAPAGTEENPVFVGGLDYAANRAAISWYRTRVVPHLEEVGAGSVVLDVIGHCPDDAAAELACEQIRFLGYVPDLEAELRRRRLAVIPVVSGTGIKTKVLEAMGAGLAVVSTPAGVTGIPVRDGEEAYIGGSPRQFAAALATAWADVEGSRRVGERGRQVAARDFSAAVLTERWRGIVARAREGSGPPLRVLFVNDYDMEKALREWREGNYPGHHLFGMAHGEDNDLDVDILPFFGFTRIKALTSRRVGDLDQQLRVLLHRRPYDVLYSGSQYDTMVLAVLKRLGMYRKPMVATVHHLAKGQLARPAVYRFVFGAHDRLMCMSRDLYDQARFEMGLPADKVALVEWGVDLDFYRPGPPARADGSSPFVLAAGKTKRDYQALADAVGGSGHRVRIYCSATSGPSLQPGWDNVEVHFSSERPDHSEALPMSELLEEYRRSAAVAIPLVPSETRGTSGLTSLMEALAMGRAVLMTDNSFMDIEQAGVGIRIAPGDVAGWRAAVAKVLDDPPLAAEMGRRARAVAEERYGLGDYSARVARILHEVCGRRWWPVSA